ncbi:hypothetical protein SAMN04488498_1453 [Mesorhizobium albiziae]|uniref:Uncharacterized protein n=1 Tax=Neomesorhizobium albiziae TaxID=335020 RepID=A0A1I4FF10_9HYPH|nr:hypothetical protein SAMN04488498_1453 [Mesorhizobium albiziae]
MELNFGPHIEQKCASLCSSLGKVSWWTLARRGVRVIAGASDVDPSG